MTYQQFAYLYDELMEDAPYSDWLFFVKSAASKYLMNAERFLDVGCGTGSMTVLLAQEGFDVTGVDLSSDMLMVAQEKAEKARVPLSLFQQDMRELEGLGEFDCVTILCDSLNYILSQEDVKRTFISAGKHMSSGGLLLFDVHSIHKINDIFIGQTYGSNEENLSYIWQCYQGELENSVEHELSFFILNGKKYDRYDECHVQRTFSVDEYTKWLKECGFELLDVTADFKSSVPTEKSERILFAAKKI